MNLRFAGWDPKVAKAGQGCSRGSAYCVGDRHSVAEQELAMPWKRLSWDILALDLIDFTYKSAEILWFQDVPHLRRGNRARGAWRIAMQRLGGWAERQHASSVRMSGLAQIARREKGQDPVGFTFTRTPSVTVKLDVGSFPRNTDFKEKSSDGRGSSSSSSSRKRAAS